MVWFQCGDCGESVKKPKVDAHMRRCSCSHWTCLDCSRSFTRHQVKEHTTCVTEHDKYAAGATKPGGFAASGFFKQTSQPAQNLQPLEGLQHLSSKPPWSCSICKVACTSRETLLSHAAGAKHKRRARAAAGGLTVGFPPVGSSASPQKLVMAHVPSSVPAHDLRLVATGVGLHDAVIAGNDSSNPPTGNASVPMPHATSQGSKKQLYKPKWKSRAVAHLSAKSHGMKLHKLQKKLLAEVGAGQDALDSLLSTLSKSSKFVLTDDRIYLNTQ